MAAEPIGAYSPFKPFSFATNLEHMLLHRRSFIGLSLAASVWSPRSRAQSMRKPLIGVLWHGTRERELANPFYHYLHEDLATQGYSEKTATVEERFAGEVQEAYGRMALELVSIAPDLLIAVSLPAALALKHATKTIPIVFVGVGDPVLSGLLTNIARPEGNITGLGNVSRETYVKRVAILKELVPRLSRIALIAHLDTVQVEQERDFYEEGATANGLQLKVFAARDKQTIDEAFERIVQAECNAIVISQQPLFYLFRDELASGALRHRLPSMAPSDAFVSSGILVAYAPLIRQRFRDLASLAARVLRGNKPNELPVQFPTVFDLAINLKTAKDLGLNLPPTVLASATQVIE